MQDFLTLFIEVIAIAGFGGILLHALYTHHTRWMQEHCPPVEPYRDNACLLRPVCVLTCALPELPQETATATPEATLETAIAPAPKRTRTRKPKAEATPKTTKPKTSARKPRKPKNPSLISD